MFKTAFRYLLYKLFAPHRKGFGVHSPFVFHLVSKVFSQKDDENLKQIGVWRKKISMDKTMLFTSNTGAGSQVHKENGRSVGSIARKSSIKHKYGRVLYALSLDIKPSTIIELGTGIGISTAYLAKACPMAQVISLEGDIEKLKFARHSFELLGLQNVITKDGLFYDLLPGILAGMNHPVLFFIDGDHSYRGTLLYFEKILKKAQEDTVVIFDDIRWSPDMERAWNEIKMNEKVSISIDLFFMGIVFFRDGIEKQDFVINF